MSEGERRIEIIAPLGRAWETMKSRLFPFNFGRWVTLGFIAWLATLGTGGGCGTFRLPSRNVSGMDFHEALNTFTTFVEANLFAIVGIGALALLLGLAVGLALTYLQSRATFMYLDCIRKNRAEIGAAWREAGTPAWSLFKVRVVLSVMAFLFMFGIPIIALIWAWPSLRAGDFPSGLIAGLVAAGIVWALLAIGMGLVNWVILDLLAAIMSVRGMTVGAAWRELRRLATGNFGVFILYWLMHVVIGMLLGMAATAAMCCTCCVAALPVALQTILQPLFYWNRSYSLFFLEQFGPEYALETATPVAEAPAPPPISRELAACPKCGEVHQIPGGMPGRYSCIKCGMQFEVR